MVTYRGGGLNTSSITNRNYGGDGNTIASNIGVSSEEGKRIYDEYFKAFPGMHQFFKRKQDEAWKNGYITISPITGHKRFIENWNDLKRLEAAFNKEFWEIYRTEKHLQTDRFYKDLLPKVRNYFKAKNTINKLALNTPIQGTGAIMMKVAVCMIFNYLIENNLIFKVFIVNQVHDEIILEAPIELSGKIKSLVKYCMEKAALVFCQRVEVKADPVISQYWVH